MNTSSSKIEQLLKDLNEAAEITQKVITNDRESGTIPAAFQKITPKPDWRMVSHTIIQGTYEGEPLSLSLDMSFLVSVKPLIKVALAQTTIKNEQLETYIKQLKPDMSPELEAIIQESLAPHSAGYLTDYTLHELIVGNTPKEALPLTPPTEGVVLMSLRNQEVCFDYHHLLPYVHLSADEFQTQAKVEIAEFQSPIPLHHSFTWKSTTPSYALEITLAIHWQPATC